MGREHVAHRELGPRAVGADADAVRTDAKRRAGRPWLLEAARTRTGRGHEEIGLVRRRRGRRCPAARPVTRSRCASSWTTVSTSRRTVLTGMPKTSDSSAAISSIATSPSQQRQTRVATGSRAWTRPARCNTASPSSTTAVTSSRARGTADPSTAAAVSLMTAPARGRRRRDGAARRAHRRRHRSRARSTTTRSTAAARVARAAGPSSRWKLWRAIAASAAGARIGSRVVDASRS